LESSGTDPKWGKFVQGLSPKAEKLVNRRWDMINIRIAGYPGYLQRLMIKKIFGAGFNYR